MKQNEWSTMLVRNQAMSLFPNNEPDTFDGTDITKFNSFVLSFKGTIESKCISDKDRYTTICSVTPKVDRVN